MGLSCCTCLTPVSEELEEGGDLYPVPTSERHRKSRQKKNSKGSEVVVPKGVKIRSNPYAEDPSASPHQIQVLKDLIPLHSVSVRVGDKYVLGRELGRGEFGVTYLCSDRVTKEEYACKSISKSKLRAAVDVEDVRREVAIMSALPQHPNIVGLHAVYEDADAVHIIMELCAGGELFDRIVSRGHYSERAAAAVLRTVAEVIRMCHAHGIIHRDLKPENFLYADSSETSPLKAIDFGLSIVGSPYYMAPEVLRRNYGPEVDIWSAGVILYILLCGFPPFWAENDQGVARAILRDPVDFEREPWPKFLRVQRILSGRCLIEIRIAAHPWLQNMKKTSNVPLGDFVRSRLKQFSVMHKFKKQAIRVIAEHLSVEEVEVIRDMFALMDTDNNGKITFEELKVGLLKVGSMLGETEMKMLMKSVTRISPDFSSGGHRRQWRVGLREFAAVSFHLLKLENDDHLRKAFSFFDQDGSGFIEFDELRKGLTNGSALIDDKTLGDILREVDTDKDGRISYEEFVAMMKAGADWRKASRQYSRERFRSMSMDLIKDGSLMIGHEGLEPVAPQDHGSYQAQRE
ncbi:unnamed protein product [Spirodela intermedia]|uniref:non-specific serine/threonine protein kinase n=1 Tax=Spirodela intermedia TaxID=51605 RepID=A0A7I8I8D6_SPIIN|nr:unnamed protein product [Spirodela intermedia]CAA6653673.1 unnamed protein product [Spirodela intermedia]